MVCSSDTQGSKVAGINITELARRSQVVEGALRDVMATGEGAAMITKFLQARGHNEVVEMIGSGGAPPSATQWVSCCSPV